MRYFAVSENLLQVIGQYLMSKPYQEVAGFIRGLESEPKEIVENPPESTPSPEN